MIWSQLSFCFYYGDKKIFDSYNLFSKKSSVSFFVVPDREWGLIRKIYELELYLNEDKKKE